MSLEDRDHMMRMHRASLRKDPGEFANCQRMAGVTRRFAGATLDNYQVTTPAQRVVRDKCVGYVKRFDRVMDEGIGLLLIGQVGTGKTHLASAMVSAALAQGRTAKICTAMQLLRAIRDTYHSSSVITTTQVINDLSETDLLVIDDVGVQRKTDDEFVQTYEVINARYGEMKPTILTSNLTITQMTEYLGKQPIDRMRERGGEVLIFDWESHRGRV